ncbi:MAG: DUF222 domain-containing protein, partial [Cellulomonas sp.]|nr:DUF222 domain-containing protein [Cellulomonas sp.]
MFERLHAQSEVAGQRLAPARDANRAQDAPGTQGAPDPRDAAGSWVVPSADVVALWAAMDAALGEPDDPRGYIQDAAERLDDYDLVELIARLERDASNVRARQLVAVEVLSRRASMNPYWPVRVAQPCVAGEEVAAALGTSRYAGRELVDTARLLAGPLLATAAALESGDIDWGKAKIVAAVLGDVAVEVALDVQDRVLPGAGARTHAQLRADLAKALIVVDPADAEQRTVRADDKRRICHPKILPDGMAGIWAVLPGVTAAAIDTALSAAARTTQRTGDPRTTDQLRADTLTHALLGHPSPPASDLGAGAQGAGALGGHANGRSHTGSGPSAATCPAGGFPPGAGFPAGAAFGLPWGNPSVPTGPAPIVPSAPTTMT